MRLINRLHSYNALTEFYLKNDNLSFAGIIDLVWRDGEQIVISDFKTGKKVESHTKQVIYYAVLWQKATGQSPSRVEVRYPERTVSLPMSESLLSKTAEELSTRISKASNILIKHPAEPNCGSHCSFCDVRQFCDNYWQDKNLLQINKSSDKAIIDIEVSVSGERTDYGFESKTNCGQVIPVVYDVSVRKVLGSLNKDDHCRILRANYKKDPLSIELKSWTEVFSRP